MNNLHKLYFFFLLWPFRVIAEFVLVTSLYNETNSDRLNEYIVCLERNLNHPAIDEIHVFYDTSKDGDENYLLSFLENNNVKISYISCRPTFNLIFSSCNDLYANRKIITSNADIYFDETLNSLLAFDLENKFLSLTRWDVTGDGGLTPAYYWLENTSQPYGSDTWIFMSPIKNIDTIGLGLGTWGCDGGIIYQAAKGGLSVLNPCKDIRCCHLHNSQVRHYPINYPSYPMAYVHAGKLSDTTGRLQIIQD
jgi:hypothetical protein